MARGSRGRTGLGQKSRHRPSTVTDHKEGISGGLGEWLKPSALETGTGSPSKDRPVAGPNPAPSAKPKYRSFVSRTATGTSLARKCAGRTKRKLAQPCR